MKAKTILVLAVVGAVLPVAGHVYAGAPAALPADVVSVDIVDSKVRATFNRGQSDDVLPGDKAYLVDTKGQKTGSDLEIFKITSGASYAMTPFTSTSSLQAQTAMAGRVTPTRSCTTSGAKPNFGASREVALGQKAPPGYAFATITTTADWGDRAFSFTLDKGSEDGVMPSSKAYLLQPNLGVPQPGTVDITWVTKTAAGGLVKNIIVSPTDAQKLARKLGFEVATCKKK